MDLNSFNLLFFLLLITQFVLPHAHSQQVEWSKLSLFSRAITMQVQPPHPSAISLYGVMEKNKVMQH